MLKQDEHAKMQKFIETMPTIIQTHLIIEPNWAEGMKKAKNLEHIITGGGAVPSLYSHLTQSHKIKTLTTFLSHLKAQR